MVTTLITIGGTIARFLSQLSVLMGMISVGGGGGVWSVRAEMRLAREATGFSPSQFLVPQLQKR